MSENKRVACGVMNQASFARKQAFHAADAACPLLECLESRVLLSDGALPVASAARASAASSAAILSKNKSTPTLCAEEDNVNVPLAVIKGRHHVSFTIEATHPRYHFDIDNHDANFDNCPQGEPGNGSQEVLKLYDDHLATSLEAVRDPNFHQPGMRVQIGKTVATGIHFIRIHRRIAGTDSWPEVLVLYSDGNLRLKPQAPAKTEHDPVFGSSVIVGPAKLAARPVALIKSITYLPKLDSLKVIYRHGGRATLRIAKMSRSVARVIVTGSYDAKPSIPFATFRSMFVEDGNTDVDHVRWRNASGVHDSSIMTFKSASASSFFFGRAILSNHNTSAPDISISSLKLTS